MDMVNSVGFGISFGSIAAFLISFAQTLVTGFAFSIGWWFWNRWPGRY